MPSAKMNRASVVLRLRSIAATTFAADFVRHALEFRERRDTELVQVGGRVHQVGVDELVDELVAQALDVHRPAAGEMQ